MFTALETTVLGLLILSARGNGNDFGFIEDARPAVPNKKALGGVIASLVKKGVIEVARPMRVNGTGEEITQFTWPEREDGTRIIPELTDAGR